jgi:hypothetical protein
MIMAPPYITMKKPAINTPPLAAGYLWEAQNGNG